MNKQQNLLVGHLCGEDVNNLWPWFLPTTQFRRCALSSNCIVGRRRGRKSNWIWLYVSGVAVCAKHKKCYGYQTALATIS